MASILFRRVTLGVALAFAAAALVMWAIIVNRPTEETIRDEGFFATEGSILDGRFELPAGEFLSVRLAFNRRISVTGTFRSDDLSQTLNCLVLSEAEFEKWRHGLEHKAVAQTGRIPGGRIDRVVEPGIYFLVFDNRAAAAAVAFSANFAAGRR